MRRAHNLDSNHRTVVDGLEFMGYSVQSLAGLGDGCPDLLVGYRGLNFLFEIKDPGKSPSRRRLTEDEALWHAHWPGQVHVVEFAIDAAKIMREAAKGRVG